MATLSSGYTSRLQEQALRCDRLRLMGNAPPACYKPIQPVPQQVRLCNGNTVQRTGQTTSSAALEFQTSQLGNYTYRGITYGVPESIRIRETQRNTLDSSTQTPITNADGTTSFLVDPANRFKEFAPYQLAPCPIPLPASATNAGNPAVRQPPCVGPNIISV